MRFFLKKVVDMSICLLSQFGCLHCDKEHSLSEFHRQYRVCGEIGSGGFGRVYKAYRLSDGLPVAVKCIRHKRVSNWTLVERWMIPTEICFMEECQDVQGVIRLICWFTSRHGFLIVMERPANFMDLFDLISTFGWLDEGVARGIFSQIVETVAELYKQHSVIHRDIKDENVVVDLDTGTVWLVDFGAAGLLERAKKQRFQGTLSYSPPEVFQRECYYPLEGTVWSLGILLYILVVGKPPFQDELQICAGKLRFPRNVSSECRALIRRCLCPTAESRISLEELQQHAWISCETTTSFFTNFETEWRRRKRDSLKSDCHRGELSDDDDDEDCSYRTEAGAEPGPLTIPPMICAAPVTQRSPTSSSFVEHHHNNNSPSPVLEESAGLDEYDERPRHESAEMCSSFPSLPSTETETGFETAPEYDEWRYEGGRLGYSSLSQCCCTSAGDDLLLDGCAFVQQHFNYAQQKCTNDDDEDDQQQQQRKASAANSLPSFGHPIHRVGFRATQSDRGSARSSSSDSNGRRSNSFTSDDSFTSSTTYFSANSHNIPLPEWSSPLSSSCVIGAVCLSNLNSKIERLNNDEEDDELTLRAEIPRQIVLKKERRRSAVSAEDEEEEDEWDDDTIRVDINSNSCAAGKCQNNVIKKTGDESPSSSSSPVIEQHQQMNKCQIEKLHLMPHSVKQLFKSDGLVEVGDGQQQHQQQNNYSARRKGGDRYRRRKGTHLLLLDGVGRPVDRRRRRLTSPPQQLNMFSFVNNM